MPTSGRKLQRQRSRHETVKRWKAAPDASEPFLIPDEPPKTQAFTGSVYVFPTFEALMPKVRACLSRARAGALTRQSRLDAAAARGSSLSTSQAPEAPSLLASPALGAGTKSPC